MKSSNASTPAVLAGVSVYLMWGFVAEYFQAIIDRGVPATVLLAHRVVWSTAFCAVLVLATRDTARLKEMVSNRNRLTRLALCAVLIAINWLSFIYAIQTHQRTDAALGYFINPLMTVAMGVLILGERLSVVKWVCVALAAIGVTMIVSQSGGRLPWIALTISLSFAFYGLVRKRISVQPVLGLTVETAILFPAAIVYLVWAQVTNPIHVSLGTYGLLALAGVVTAIPLLLFGYAARHLTLGTMGFLQYIGPTCQLLMAVLVRHEPIRNRLGGFVLIWIALAVFSLSAVRWRRIDAAAEAGM
ncbi:MAG: EamA family transporter RarD [Tepidisphaeraceae bacterium]